MVVIIWQHTFDKVPLPLSQVNYFVFFPLKVNHTSKQYSEHCEASALVGEAETLWEKKLWKTRHKKKLSSNLINDGFEKASAFRETAAESEGCRLQLGGIATLPMSEHLRPGGSWCGQHFGSWGVCPRWSSGPGKRRTGHRAVVPHRSPGLSARGPLLCRVWGKSAKNGLSVPVQLCDCRGTMGLYNWLEPYTFIRYWWVNTQNHLG